MKNLSIDKIHPTTGDVVILNVDTNKVDFHKALNIFKELREVLPEGVSIVTLPTGMELKTADREFLLSLQKSLNAVLVESVA